MLWVNLYKTGLTPQVGLLTSSYYVDYSPTSPEEFWKFAAEIRDFDMAFEGSQTTLELLTAQEAQSGANFVGSKSWVYTPPGNPFRGAVQINTPSPWRWCLNVAMYTGFGRPSHHWHHDSIDRDTIALSAKGRVMWTGMTDARDWLAVHFRQYGAGYADWLNVGKGSATPGNALAFEPVRQVVPIGITLMNKARRRQALVFHKAVTFQAKIVALMNLSAQYLKSIMDLRDLFPGDYVPGQLRTLVTNLMGTVVAMAQGHKDNNFGPDGKQINSGQGWAVRYGPTGATYADQEIRLDKKRTQDLKYLQKFDTFQGADGETYFHQAEAREWFEAGYDWGSLIGAFGGFDFLNPFQKGLDEKDRLDNYTPWWPDLPTRIDGLPKPTKNPNSGIQLPGFVV